MGMLGTVGSLAKDMALNGAKEESLRDAVKTETGATGGTADAIDAVVTKNPWVAGVKAALHSEPAYASVVDETRSPDYLKAQADIKAGKGDVPGPADSLWGALKYKVGLADNPGGPTPNQVVQQAEQRQSAYDAEARKFNPNHQDAIAVNALEAMNQFNPRAHTEKNPVNALEAKRVNPNPVVPTTANELQAIHDMNEGYAAP